MSYTEMKASEIIKIIEACSKAKVNEIKIADIEIKFHADSQIHENYEYNEESLPLDQQNFNEPLANRQESSKIPLEDLALIDPVEWDKIAQGDES